MKYEALPGDSIEHAAQCMQDLSDANQVEVTCEINGVPLTTSPGNESSEIVSAFCSEMDRRQASYAASPEGREEARQIEEHRLKAQAAAAEGILPFKVRDEEAWQKCLSINGDGYGACVVRYAARWAHLMERALANGSKIEDVADITSHDADVEGVTGFMYAAALSVLCQVWEHGEELRRWRKSGSFPVPEPIPRRD